MGIEIRAAAAVLLTRGDRFWLGLRGKTRFLPGFSVFPGGACEKGEAPLTAALRELQEETGIDLSDSATLLPFARAITPAYSKYRFDVLVYRVELAEEFEPVPDGREFISGHWYNASEALDARAAGDLQLAPPTFRQILEWQQCLRAEKAWPDESRAFASPPQRNEQVLPFCPGLTVIPLATRAMPPAAWTNAAIVGEKSLYVIDPGGPEIDALREELERLTHQGATVKGVVLSHHHPDHIEGYQALELQQLPLYCHPLTSPLLPGDFPSPVHLAHGDTLPTDDGFPVVCHFTPGHAPGHLAFHLPLQKALLAGDMISSLSSIVLPSDNGSLPDYLNSLKQLRSLEANLVVPSHGPPYGAGSDPFGEAIAHRELRERQVLKLLNPEARSVEDLTAVLYRAIDPRLIPAARANLKHHLLKLERDGLALQSSTGWALKE